MAVRLSDCRHKRVPLDSADATNRYRVSSTSRTRLLGTAVSRPLLFLVLGLNLGACSEYAATNSFSAAASEPQRAEKMSRSEDKSFNGWGPFTFGMNFDDALAANPRVVWEAASLRKCRDEMSLGGCTLITAEGSHIPLSAGVALLPGVIFNQDGKLAAVRLSKFLRANMAPAPCERAYGQLLDDLYETWGAPTATYPNGRGMLRRSTPKGREFFLGRDDGAVVGRETFHVQPDGRQVILRSGYIGATDSAPAVCHLSIYYRGPESLQPPPEERPHPLKNWY